MVNSGEQTMDNRESKKKLPSPRKQSVSPDQINFNIPYLEKAFNTQASRLSFSKMSYSSRVSPMQRDTSFMEQTLRQVRTYIGPGSIGSQKTQIQWNKASNHFLGTNKTSALRLDQYHSRPDITSTIDVDPHESRFVKFEALPHINSKYKTAFKGPAIKKTLGRDDQPTNAGHTITIDNPSNPAKTNFYAPEIPKFYPGQPGFKQFLKEMKNREPVK